MVALAGRIRLAKQGGSRMRPAIFKITSRFTEDTSDQQNYAREYE